MDVSMLLPLVLLLELRILTKSDISSGVVGDMKNDPIFSFSGNQKIFSQLVVRIIELFTLMITYDLLSLLNRH